MLSNARTECSNAAQRQRGLSLVELMVGIAVGLFVVAGASFVVSMQLGDNRRLLLETQVQQDLRATADTIVKELRRAGSWRSAQDQVWQPPGGFVRNPRTTITVADGSQAAGYRSIEFEYELRTAGGTQVGPWGFMLDGGVIRSRLGAAGWQDLTDGNAMIVTDFRIRPLAPIVHAVPCPTGCGGNPADESCWPTLIVRGYSVEIDARAASDANVQRSIRSEVRLRNEQLAFDPALPVNRACPS